MRTKNVYVGNQRVVSVLNPDEQTRYEYYYHTDHLGSTTYLTDRDGKLKEHIEYTPWGEGWIEQPINRYDLPQYLFTGKELDATGLYYYGARYYDPRISMWLSADPIVGKYIDGTPRNGVFNSKNLALYSYAHLNPIKFIDFFGLSAEDAEPPPPNIIDYYETDRGGVVILGDYPSSEPSIQKLPPPSERREYVIKQSPNFLQAILSILSLTSDLIKSNYIKYMYQSSINLFGYIGSYESPKEVMVEQVMITMEYVPGIGDTMSKITGINDFYRLLDASLGQYFVIWTPTPNYAYPPFTPTENRTYELFQPTPARVYKE